MSPARSDPRGSGGDETGARAPVAADVSVLMPVYAGTEARHLDQALRSLARQSAVAGRVLLIQDGDLTAEHQRVIEAAGRSLPALRVLRPGPVGLVGALNAGLAAAESTWVMRMDADDVAEHDRLAAQLAAAAESRVDVVGAAMREFRDDETVLGPTRHVPETHDDIVRALARLNPINHPTVLLRRDAVIEAGGYVPIAGMEDYHLWARMAAGGARFRNLPQPLVRYRVDADSYKRRADPAAIRAEWRMQQHLVRLGLVRRPRALLNLVVRVTFRLLPPFLMRPAYSIVRATLGRGSARP
jgi:cellulose synthase/poly-beta-1,6-N-acetylglucosamine synthase-like glycosyltransferase